MENSERDGNTRPPDRLLRNLYEGQEATVRTGRGTTDWFQNQERPTSQNIENKIKNKQMGSN